jgi:tetratricopeptide (TPR) repeat protein
MSKRPLPSSEQPSTIAEALAQASRALRSGRPDEAERLAAPVLKSNRGNLLAAQILGSALLMQKRPGEAIEPLRRATRRADNPAIETLLAKALAAVGRRDEAVDQLRQATTRRPPFPQAFVELGDLLGAGGRSEEAIAVFESGLALTPDAAVLRIGLGYVHLGRNDRAKARDQFSRARAAAPERRDAVIALARVLALDGEYAAAAELYRLALHARPDDAERRIELGKCLLEMGRRDDGEASLRTATRGGAQWAGPAIKALAATPRGRFFLRPSSAARFLGVETL